MKNSHKIFIITILTLIFTQIAYSVEVEGTVKDIFTGREMFKGQFDKVCVTFIESSNGKTIGLVEDYYFCTLALKYKIGEILTEDIADNIIISAEDVEPDLNKKLQTINSKSYYLVIDY